MNSSGVDLPARQHLARPPDDRPRARPLAVEPAVQHRPTGEDDRRDVDGRGGHDLRRRRLVAAGRQHDAVDRVAVEDLDEREVLEVAVEHRGRALARLLDRMDRETRTATPPASRIPSRTRLARTRWCRLHGVMSEPVCAIPMIGLPDCSSSSVSP